MLVESWHRCLFAASLLLLVTGLDAQSCYWTPYYNTLIYGGTAVSANTLQSCQATCLASSGCVGVDWAPGNAAGNQCYLLQKKTDKVQNVQGVNHYDYDCPDTSCQFIYFENTNIYGGNLTTDNNLDACKATCRARPGCQGIDWEPGSSRCFLLGKQTDKNYNVQGVAHYDLVCSGSTQFPGSPTLTPFGQTTLQGSGMCNFVRYDNMNIYGGSMNQAMSESACQDACRAMYGCQGIDWSPSNPSGQQCFLHNKTSPKNSVSGVTHYDYLCNGTSGSTPVPLPTAQSECRASVDVYPDTSSVGGSNIPQIRDILVCNAACQEITSCLGFDFTTATGCWVHYNRTSFPQKYYQPGVTQFKFNRCPEEGITSCTPSYVNNVLVDTCISECYPKWMRLDNTAGFGGQVNYNVGQRNFSACLEYCFDRSDCIGVDYSEAPGNQSVCTYYLSYQTSALYNVTTKPYVTQYRIQSRCDPNCTVYWNRMDNTRYGLYKPRVLNTVTTQADCERMCFLSETCEAYQFTKSGADSPSCTLADDFYIGSGVTDYTVYTGLFQENCNRTLPPTTPGPGSGSICYFVGYANTNIYGGSMNQAMTESACQDACRALPDCRGIDWSPGSPAGQQCFIQYKTGPRNSVSGVTHYDYICYNNGTCWQKYSNTLIYGGELNPATSLTDCQNVCQARGKSACMSIDWSYSSQSGSQCYLLNTQLGKTPNQQGVDHYDYTC